MLPNGQAPTAQQEIVPHVRLIYRETPGGGVCVVGVEIAGQRVGNVVKVSTAADTLAPVPMVPGPDGKPVPVIPTNLVKLHLECLWPFTWVKDGTPELVVASRILNGGR